MKKLNRTRCPECWMRLEFSDKELADTVIERHLNSTKCDKYSK